MATTIEQQVALDEALVPSIQRLRIGRSNFRLPSDIQSKESTLQVVYDVLRRSPFFKAFLVTADVPVHMQEFWATAYVHQHSIIFKMDTRKNIVDLESFREMLHISPRISGQSFAELPFKEEILEFLRFLGHSAQIKTLTDKKRQLCLSHLGRFCISSGTKESKKKSNEMYYPRFIKVIIHHFMTKKPSMPRRNKVNWHYVRDDILFSTIKVAYKEYYACATGEAAPKLKASARRKRGSSASSTTPPTPIATPTPITTVVATPRLTAAAKGKQPARATSPTDPSEIERTEAEQLKIILKRSRQETHISQHGGSSTDEGTGSKPGVLDYHLMTQKKKFHGTLPMMKILMIKLREEMTIKEKISKIDEQEATESGKGDDEDTKSSGDDEEIESDQESEEEETREKEEESFDPIPKTPEDSEDTGNVRKKGYMKRKRQMNSTETSTLTREGDYNYLKMLKTLT
nr:hypothetical protein [Tanacetum cinerariifolium]